MQYMYSTFLCYQTLGRTVMNGCLPDKSEFLVYVILILKSQNEMIVNSVTVTSHRNHFQKQKIKIKLTCLVT